MSFRPSHTLVVTTNHRPVVSDTDHGTWRRLRMVPFPKTFGRDGQPIDRNLRGRLMDQPAQQEAVLAWLIEGAQAWFSAEMILPPDSEAIRNATQTWRETSDLIYAFVQDCLRARPGHSIEVTKLLEEFNYWQPAGHHDWGLQTFSERFAEHEAMRRLGAERGKDPTTRRAVFKNIGLRLE